MSMTLLEQKYRAGQSAKRILEDAGFYGPLVLSHARQMVADGQGDFKFVKKYGNDGGAYANATLWVLDNTTRTMQSREMEIVEINGLNEPKETTLVDENYRPIKLTLAQAEVAAALYGLTNVDPLPQVEPNEVFPQRNNIHNGARRTFRKLVESGLIETLPAGHFPRYKATQALFDALIEWKNNPRNYDAFQSFELACY